MKSDITRPDPLIFVLSLLPILILLRPISFLEFVWLIAFCGFILTIVFALLFFSGRAIILWIFPKRTGKQIVLTIVWIALIMVGLTTLVFRVTNLPVPKWLAVHVNAAGSLRATAGDMATFMIELSNPQYLSAEMATQLQIPQIILSRDLSWGLGSGI